MRTFQKNLKPLDVLITWVITLLVGFVIITLVMGEFDAGMLGTLFSGFFSLAYVVLAMILCIWIKPFWVFQLFHFLIASASAFVIYIVDEAFVSILFWVAWPYFVVGAVIQYLWMSLRENKPKEEIAKPVYLDEDNNQKETA